MRRKKTFSMLLAAALLWACLSACAHGEEEAAPEITQEEVDASTVVSGELLTAGEAADNVFSLTVDYNKGLNPLTTESSLNVVVDALVYDTIFQVDDNYNVTSRVLSDWYFVENDDGGVWVLVVKPGIAMHDGSTLTADDIVYSIQRAYIHSDYYQQRMGWVYASGSGDTAYVMNAEYTNAVLPARLTIPIIKAGSVLEEVPVGSGPYMYSEERDSLVLFDAYEGAESMPLKTIYLRQYTDSEDLISDYESALVDLTVNDLTSIYNMGYGGKNEKRVFSTTNMHYIGFNSNSTFLRYAQYRYALNWIIDREAIAEDVLDGAATASALPIHPNSSMFDPVLNDTLSYDLEQCLLELEKLGCRDLDGDGELEFAISGSMVEITINFIVCSDTTSKVIAARRIAEDMQAIGLPVTLRELSWSEYRAALIADEDDEDAIPFDMFYGEVSLTPDWDLIPLLGEERPMNFGNWKLPEVESAVLAYLAANDDTRPEALRIMLQKVAEEGAILPVCFERREVISHLGIIKGMTPNQYNVFQNLENWTIALDG